MSTYRLRFEKGGEVPPVTRVGFVMQRTPGKQVAALLAPTPAAEPEPLTIGAGADNWADATEIPFEDFRDVVAAYTYNKNLTTEPGETGNIEWFDFSYRTAWWKFFVPANEFCIISADTSLSFGSDPAEATDFPEPPDTNLGIWRGESLDDLQSGATGAQNEDRVLDDYTSLVHNKKLSGSTGGRWFYIQVGQYSDGPDICYVLRVSLRCNSYPWTIPADGHDPAN